MTIPFIKMHGIGNDFVVLCQWSLSAEGPTLKSGSELAKQMLDRRLGVGGDQLLWVLGPADNYAGEMLIFNADGSRAEMCGNGIRAIGILLAEKTGKNQFFIKTAAGMKEVWVENLKTAPCLSGDVRVEMGVPKILGSQAGERLKLSNGVEVVFYEINVGNPHAVIFVDDLSQVPAVEWGPLIENHPRFPKRTNVEFVQVLKEKSAQKVRVVVWERGAGLTLACGTGACAVAAASFSHRSFSHGAPISVELPGGTLQIEWKGGEFPLFMSGPAVEVFRGEFKN